MILVEQVRQLFSDLQNEQVTVIIFHGPGLRPFDPLRYYIISTSRNRGRSYLRLGAGNITTILCRFRFTLNKSSNFSPHSPDEAVILSTLKTVFGLDSASYR